MTLKYYFRNFFWGWIPVLILLIDIVKGSYDDKFLIVFILSLFSALLFPVAKFNAELFALSITKKQFWKTAFFKDYPSKSGLWAIFYLFCFIFAIPLSVSSLFLKK